jgi:ABC-type phosphate/phosphonate transport system substrate-binding protein
MKKVVLGLISFLAVLFLAACGSSSQTAVEQEEQFQATLVVDFGDKVDSQEISFEQGDTVMDILEEHFEVESEAGMVTAIDGVSQDAAANTYWMYDINDELAPKGAEEMTISEGDTITFYLETFE